MLALSEVDRLLMTEPELRDVLGTVGRDGARLRMHLLMTAADPSVPHGLPCLPVSVQDGHGSLGAQPFRLVPVTPGQLLEFADTFTCYNHPVRSLWKPHGQSGCGKTTVLRTVLRGLAASDAVVLGLDQVAPVVARVRDVLRQRLADPKSWEGPELFLVADDYDTVPVDADARRSRSRSTPGRHRSSGP